MTLSSLSSLTLDEFLVEAKQHAFGRLQAGCDSSQKLTLIMGNEAGDLDSAACAIGLSYLLSRFGSPSNYHLPQSRYVPLVQSVRTDEVLRPENTLAFRASGIDPQHILYLDDVQHTLGLELDSDAFSPAANVAMGLVDHASLTPAWRGAGAANRNVDIVLDHHQDVHDHMDATLRIIRCASHDAVASCSSLVAQLFANHFVNSSSSDVGMRHTADLLISAIIIDTHNLRRSPRGNATPTDVDAINSLLPTSSFSNATTLSLLESTALSLSPLNQPPSPQRDASSHTPQTILSPYWHMLSHTKQSIRHLPGGSLLRRDYKQLTFTCATPTCNTRMSLNLGFASMPISIVEWLHKDRPFRLVMHAPDANAEMHQAWQEWWKVLDEFMTERNIDLAIVSATFRVAQGEVDAGKHRRELVVAFAPLNMCFTQARRLWDELRNGLETDAHVTDDAGVRLMLQQPWEGQRLGVSLGAKNERVEGVDQHGKRQVGGLRWGKVYRQMNASANRKVIMPSVMTILKMAMSKL